MTTTIKGIRCLKCGAVGEVRRGDLMSVFASCPKCNRTYDKKTLATIKNRLDMIEQKMHSSQCVELR